jgi:hypothetical protein
MRDGSSGSGFQNAISVIRYASSMIRCAKPKAWKVSTLRAWMPSAWPIASRPGRRSTMRVVMPGNWESWAAVVMPAGARPYDQDVDLVRKLPGPVKPDAGRRTNAWIA